MGDKVATSELKRILERIEGRMSLEESVWDEDPKEPKDYESQASFDSELLAVSRIKHAYKLVVELEKTIRSIMAKGPLPERLSKSSRRFGIDILPDSVLARIFNIVVQDAIFELDGTAQIRMSDSHKRRLALTSTSSRFSMIVKSTPSLSTYITIQARDSKNQKRRKRTPSPSSQSESAHLTVNLLTSERLITEGDLPNSVRSCRALFLRFNSKSLKFADEYYAMSRAYSLPGDKQVRGMLPTLESLDISCEFDHAFFDMWQTPNLKHLYLVNNVPPPSITSSLTTLVIRRKLGMDRNVKGASLAQIVQVLRSARKLRHLVIESNECCSFQGAGAGIDLQALALEGTIAIELPHLTSLEIATGFEGPVEAHAFRAVRLLTDPMQVPELRDLKLRYTTEQLPAEEDEIPFRNKKLEKLQTLSLRIIQTAKRCKSRPKTKKDGEDFESEARKNGKFITGFLCSQPSLVEVSIFSQKCTDLLEYISACPNIRLFRFEGGFLDVVETISETVKGMGVDDSNPDLQYCDVQSTAFTIKGTKKLFVRSDYIIRGIRFVWKEERFVQD